MKKCILAVAAAGLAACSFSAFAQSSVTLYGVIENGIDYYNNSGGKQLVEMRDGTYTGVFGSRWGLQGTEDLGGGLSAIFKLENGFNTPNGATGQGGREFGRQAYVGFRDNTYGAITLGRQYDSVVDYLQFAGGGSQWGGIVTHASDIDNIGNSYRINNAIKYTSPNIHGLVFGGLYAFSDDTSIGGAGTTAAQSAGLNYTYGPLKFGAAYYYLKHPATYITDGHYVANTTGAAVGDAGPWSYVGQPDNARTIGAGVSYLIGKTTLRALYTQARFGDANGTASAVRFDDYDVSISYAFTPSTHAGVAYLYTDGHVDYSGQTPKYHRIALGLMHSLSKRTSVYIVGVFQQATGDAKGADIYQGTAANMSSTNRQVGVRAAMIHSF